MNYNRPGNIRELEHMIERSIIVSGGAHLTFESVFTGGYNAVEQNSEPFQTLE